MGMRKRGAMAVAVMALVVAGCERLTVEPATGLADGDVVQVTGAGFAAGSSVTVYQCGADLVGIVDCDLGTATEAVVDADGHIALDQQVFAIIHTWGDDELDCRASEACVLAANVGFDGTAPQALQVLDFAPDAPLLPPPTVTATPGEGLVTGQVVDLEGTGFVRKETRAPLPLDAVEVNIFQCAHNGFGLSDCRAEPLVTVPVDSDGTFAADVPVVARFASIGHIDCRTAAEPCRLVASPGSAYSPLAASVELNFDADAEIPEWPMPELTVSPAAGLPDFREVSVTGTGFSPGGPVEVAVCRADQPTECNYIDSETPTASVDGRIDGDLAIFAETEIFRSPVDCRVPPGCVVRAHDLDRELTATVPLAFGPPDGSRGRYLDPVFDEAEIQVDRDVVYRETVDAEGNPVQLAMDIFRPADDTVDQRPAVVWMHGGFFMGGDKSSMHDDAMAFARRGYVAVSLQYRLRPGISDRHGMYLASLDAYDDAVAGVEWLKAHADEYGISPDTIMAGGFSAGALTASNLAYLPGERGPDVSPVAAATARSGLIVTDPAPGDPPLQVIHGTTDTITSYENVRPMCQAATDTGTVCEIVAYDGTNHGPSGGPSVTRHTVDFFAQHVLGPQGFLDPAPGEPSR